MMQAWKLRVAPQFLLSVPGGRAASLALAGFVFSTMAAKYQDVSSAASLPQVSILELIFCKIIPGPECSMDFQPARRAQCLHALKWPGMQACKSISTWRRYLE